MTKASALKMQRLIDWRWKGRSGPKGRPGRRRIPLLLQHVSIPSIRQHCYWHSLLPVKTYPAGSSAVRRGSREGKEAASSGGTIFSVSAA